MECRPPTPILMIAILWVIPARSALVGQSSAPKSYVHACDLVTNADVEKVTRRHLKDDPGRLSTVQHTESGCDFWDASIQVALISSRMPRKWVSHVLESNGFDQTEHTLSGVGESASIYFTTKGREPEGLLVSYVGPLTLTVRVKMKAGQSPESAQPYAVGLAKIAVARLPRAE
jgi:hypothetical protein